MISKRLKLDSNYWLNFAVKNVMLTRYNENTLRKCFQNRSGINLSFQIMCSYDLFLTDEKQSIMIHGFLVSETEISSSSALL